MATAWLPLIDTLVPEAIKLIGDLVSHFRKHPSSVTKVATAVKAAGVNLSSTSLDPDVTAP